MSKLSVKLTLYPQELVLIREALDKLYPTKRDLVRERIMTLIHHIDGAYGETWNPVTKRYIPK
jgi:hypothetical protein